MSMARRKNNDRWVEIYHPNSIASNLPISIFPERLLNRRCGQLLSAQQAQIESLPIAGIENLAEALLDFKGMKDLEIWLNDVAKA